MSGQNETATSSADNTAAKEADGEAGQARQRSTIQFPYSSLADAVAVAQAIHDHVGHGACDDDQLAAWLDQSPKSSGFRTQLSAARLFGVIEGDGTGQNTLSPLGRQIVDPNQARAARVRAFLNVPLYKSVFEKYKGSVLPPAAAFERDIAGLGVAEKQKERARQVLERSAELAGFYENGKNRLVQPGVASGGIVDDDSTRKKDETGGGGGGGGNTALNLDPLLMALLQKIPKKEEGWAGPKRARWFRTFAMNVSQIYDGDDNPVELKIDEATSN